MKIVLVKPVLVLLCLYLLTGGIAALAEPAPAPIYGDVNGDGIVDVEDLLEIIDIIFEVTVMPDLPPGEPVYGDVNGDGVVDVQDLLEVIDVIFEIVEEEVTFEFLQPIFSRNNEDLGGLTIAKSRQEVYDYFSGYPHLQNAIDERYDEAYFSENYILMWHLFYNPSYKIDRITAKGTQLCVYSTCYDYEPPWTVQTTKLFELKRGKIENIDTFKIYIEYDYPPI